MDADMATDAEDGAALPEEAAIEKPATDRKRRGQRRTKILLGCVLVLLFLVYAFTTNYIPSRSMTPTLRPGDHILTMRSWLAYPGGRPPKRGDIIVFLMPEADATDKPSDPPPDGIPIGSLRHVKGDILIKRVAGLPGESIMVRGNQVWIDGKPISLPQVPASGGNADTGLTPYAYAKPLKLSEDQVFLLGDNSGVSDDSRFWGPLSRRRIIGRFVCVLFHEGREGPNRKHDDSRRKDPSEGL